MTDQLLTDASGHEIAWDFFLAHTSADVHAAEHLYDLLTQTRSRHVRVFLDSRSLKLGDDWDLVLPDAQRRSRITVVLVSSHSQSAYYQREEVAAAVAMAREIGTRHRVVPLFIGDVQRQELIPYGLRLKHGLTVADEEKLDSAAWSLLGLLDDLETIPERILVTRATKLEHDGNGDISLKTLADGTSRAAASIHAFVAALEDMVRSGVRTIDFLADRRERSRLRSLLMGLMSIEISQTPLPWLLRGYRPDKSFDNWGQVTATIASLTPQVAQVTELLASCNGSFMLSALDAYKSLLFSLRERSDVYARVEALKRPSSPEGFAYLEAIAAEYDRMISDLNRAQEAIAKYLAD